MRWWLRAALAAAVVCGVLSALHASGGDPPPENTEPVIIPGAGPFDEGDPRLHEDPRKRAFEPSPAGPGEIDYADQPAAVKAKLDEMQERAEVQHGPQVQQAWSRAAQSERQRAVLGSAENEAGIRDADLLGVR